MSEDPANPVPSKSERQRQRADQRRLEAQEGKRSSQQRAAMWTVAIVAALVVGVTALIVMQSGSPAPTTQAGATPGSQAGVETYPVTDQSHVEGAVTYEQTPPVGGPHSSVWQNCGVYEEPIANENAVHSMEHGAVWITHNPELPASDIEALRSVGEGNPYVLVSPHPDVSGVVASAWTKQLSLDTMDESRLREFVTNFAQGPQTPEPGAPCTGGIGEPAA